MVERCGWCRSNQHSVKLWKIAVVVVCLARFICIVNNFEHPYIKLRIGDSVTHLWLYIHMGLRQIDLRGQMPVSNSQTAGPFRVSICLILFLIFSVEKLRDRITEFCDGITLATYLRLFVVVMLTLSMSL